MSAVLHLNRSLAGAFVLTENRQKILLLTLLTFAAMC